MKFNREKGKANEIIKIEFEILTDEIAIDEINKFNTYREKRIAYLDLDILATFKRINNTEYIVEVDDFIVHENFDIINIKDENRDSLVRQYDYSISFDPETYEIWGNEALKPNEYALDSTYLEENFNFYLSGPDTFLIRMKDSFINPETSTPTKINWDTIYSNWDTLIIR